MTRAKRSIGISPASYYVRNYRGSDGPLRYWLARQRTCRSGHCGVTAAGIAGVGVVTLVL